MPRPLFALLLLAAATTGAAEEFSFDLSGIEKKPLQWYGFAELRDEAIALNRDSALYPLTYPDAERSENRLSASLELSGDYTMGDTRLSATWHGQTFNDSRQSGSEGTLYEGYLYHRLNRNLSIEAGKRTLKWGKGYAWSPVAFVERPKDPTDPELGREGFVMATGDWVKSGNGALQTIGFTPVLLPVSDELNEDFGQEHSTNIAGKLYLLYRDIDIDLLFLSDGSRPGRLGADFSLNLASNFELHGEWAWIPDAPHYRLDGATLTREEQDQHNILLGLRYLTASDTTWIAEYLHQSGGYSEAEMATFFAQLAASPAAQSVRDLGQQAGFLRPNPMRNYLYLRASQKEPFDWLYTSTGITLIANLDDQSHMVMPEFIYSGVENLELRLRLSLMQGDAGSEYGEKLNEKKLELRGRYYF